MRTYLVVWSSQPPRRVRWFYSILESNSAEPESFARAWRDADTYGPFHTLKECEEQGNEEYRRRLAKGTQ